MSRFPDSNKKVVISKDGETWKELEGCSDSNLPYKVFGSEGWQQRLKDSYGWKESLDSIVEFNERAGTECKYRSLDDDSVLFQKHLIDEEKQELDEAFENNDRKEVCDALCDIIVVTAGALHRLGYDPVKAMSIVHNSNMSKFVEYENDDDVYESISKYDDDDRYTDISVDMNGAVWGTVVATGGRKILKGCNYQAPDWTQLDPELK